MNFDNLVPVKEEDFLDQDPALRGQNYVCLSFLSPEEVLKKKDVYFLEQFLGEFSKDMTEFFDKLSEKYKEDIDVLKMIKDRYSYIFDGQNLQEEYQYFTNSRSSELEALFHEKNNFQTSIRGLKVRGVFDSMREAEVRSQVLKRMDNKFHVYVAQVGCWCPWSPNPDDITDQEYAETNLNTLMKNYKENQDKKDLFFEERKRDLQFIKTKEKLEEKDNWMANKENEIIVSDETPLCPVNSPKSINVDEPIVVIVEPTVDEPVVVIVEPTVDEPVVVIVEPTVDKPIVVVEPTVDKPIVVVEPTVDEPVVVIVEPTVDEPVVVEPNFIGELCDSGVYKQMSLPIDTHVTSKIVEKQLSHHISEQIIKPNIELPPVDEMAHVYARRNGLTFEAAFAELAHARDKANNKDK
jgi:hypothetical protein